MQQALASIASIEINYNKSVFQLNIAKCSIWGFNFDQLIHLANF